MPITRSQTQIPHQRPGRNFRGRGHARTQAPPPPVAPIRGYTGLQYDTQNLSPNTARRAIDGLESDFLVDRVQSHGSGLERYYAFQLKAPFAVRVHNPAAGQSRVECTCEDFRSNRHTCAHIFVSRSSLSNLNTRPALVLTMPVVVCWLARSTHQPASSRCSLLNSDRSNFTDKCAIPSYRGTARFLASRAQQRPRRRDRVRFRRFCSRLYFECPAIGESDRHSM